MPRKLRFNLVGVPQHIVQRGNNRQAAFFAHEDYLFYLDCLKEAAAKFGGEVHAYVLMTDHVHLLVTPQDPEGASRLMQSVGRRYAQYVNYTYRRTGTLWDGRYRASLIESERYLLICCRYIELNPVRARMVEAPADYRWSSYRHHALGHADPVITDQAQYLALGATEAARRQAYQELCRNQLEPGELKRIREALNLGLVLGDDRFREQIEQALNRSVRVARRGRPTKRMDHEQGTIRH